MYEITSCDTREIIWFKVKNRIMSTFPLHSATCAPTLYIQKACFTLFRTCRSVDDMIRDENTQIGNNINFAGTEAWCVIDSCVTKTYRTPNPTDVTCDLEIHQTAAGVCYVVRCGVANTSQDEIIRQVKTAHMQVEDPHGSVGDGEDTDQVGRWE